MSLSGACEASNMKSQNKFVIVCGLLLGGVGMVVAGGVCGIMPLMAIGIILIGLGGVISMTTSNSTTRRTTSGWKKNPLTAADNRILV
jgi:NAD/NADP transhydrogenase beta subunit